MEKIKQNAFVKKVGFNRIILVGVMLLMYLAFGALTGGKFFTVSRLMNIFNYVYFLGFLALGVTFVIATGGIDFSIGPVMFCCALVSGYSFFNYGIPMGLALVLCILVGLLFGVWNGYLVAYIKIPPFIVSMASMNIAKGIAAVFTKTQSVSWPQSSDPAGWYRSFVKAGNFPTGIVIFLVVAVICAIILNKTKANNAVAAKARIFLTDFSFSFLSQRINTKMRRRRYPPPFTPPIRNPGIQVSIIFLKLASLRKRNTDAVKYIVETITSASYNISFFFVPFCSLFKAISKALSTLFLLF